MQRRSSEAELTAPARSAHQAGTSAPQRRPPTIAAGMRSSVGLSASQPTTAIGVVDEDEKRSAPARRASWIHHPAKGRLAKHLLPVLGDRALADLTAAEVTAWRNGMVKSRQDDDAIRKSRDSANRMLAMTKAAFNLAFNTGRVTDDRAWRRVQAFKGVGEARKIILSDPELQHLVDVCEAGLRELVLIGAWTGARLGEITWARVRDLDVSKGMLRIRGKTGSREIHLPPASLALFRKLASGKRPDAHLLATADGAPWTASLHARRFTAAVRRAGLNPETTYYALRHSYISRALVAGVPTKAVADHCGTSVMMIERYYAKFIPGDRARYAAAAAPELFGAMGPPSGWYPSQ